MKNEVLTDYIIKNITPLESQRDRIKKLYEELCSFLGADSCFQTGSYARFTAIRPVKDLDIFYVFATGATPAGVEGALPDLAKRLEDEFSLECSESFEVEKQDHSIRLQFDEEFSIDVVPAIDTGKTTPDLKTPIYIVPDEKTGGWTYSDPKGYKEVTKQVDEATDKKLRRAIRFVKMWRRGCKQRDDDFKLKSFHVEQIFIEIFQEHQEMELSDAIKLFFSEVPSNLLSPRFKDRANNQIFVDQYIAGLTTFERDQIILWSQAQLRKMEQIDVATNEAQILDIIKGIMLCSSPAATTAHHAAAPSQSFVPAGQHSSTR